MSTSNINNDVATNIDINALLTERTYLGSIELNPEDRLEPVTLSVKCVKVASGLLGGAKVIAQAPIYCALSLITIPARKLIKLKAIPAPIQNNNASIALLEERISEFESRLENSSSEKEKERLQNLITRSSAKLSELRNDNDPTTSLNPKYSLREKLIFRLNMFSYKGVIRNAKLVKLGINQRGKKMIFQNAVLGKHNYLTNNGQRPSHLKFSENIEAINRDIQDAKVLLK